MEKELEEPKNTVANQDLKTQEHTFLCTRLQDSLIAANAYVSKVFEGEGLFIARNVWIVLIISLIVSGTCGIGLIQLEFEDNNEKLWIPEGPSWIKENQDWVNEQFGPEFNPSKILIASKTDDENVLRPEVVEDLFILDNAVRALRVQNGTGCSFSDCLCGPDTTCTSAPSILDVFCSQQQFRSSVLTAPDPQASLLAAVNQQHLCDQRQVSKKLILGKPSYSPSPDGNEQVFGAKSIEIVYLTMADSDWLHAFRDLALGFNSSNFRVTVFYKDFIKEEAKAEFKHDIVLLLTGLALVLCCLCGIFSREGLPRVLLGLCGVTTLAFAFLAGYGLCGVVGVPLSFLTALVPVPVTAMGVMNMMHLFHTFHTVKRQHPHLILEDHIQFTYSLSGWSISITGFTTAIAFLIGLVTDIPIFRHFAICAALNVFFTTLHMRFTFVACLVLVDHYFGNHAAAFDSTDISGNNSKAVPPVLNSLKEYFSGPSWVILPVPIRLAHVVPMLAVVVLSCISMGSVKEGLDMEDIAPDDSPIQDYYTLYEDTYGSQIGDRPMGMYFVGSPTLDQSDPANQFAMLRARESAFNISNYASTRVSKGGLSPETVWLHHLYGFAAAQNMHVVPCVRILTPEQCQEEYAPQFMVPQESFKSVLQAMIRFNPSIKNIVKLDERDDVKASLFPINTIDIPVGAEAKFYEDMREVELKVNSEVFSSSDKDVVSFYSKTLVLAQTQVWLLDQLFQTLGLSLVVVAFFAVCTLINPFMVLLMIFQVAAVDVILCGFLYSSNTRLNQLSVAVLLMAVSISLNYSFNLAYSFLTIKVNTRSERIYKTLKSTGFVTALAGIFVLLGMIPVAIFSKSVAFRVFGQMFCIAVLFALYGGLIVLPIGLSFFGPEALVATQSTEIIWNSNPLGGRYSVDYETREHEAI